ncbi:hypothetical protein F4777DRAFT_543523 [Nemania sp. FL0916]|nr:hypothetical protein F4777DRAFT_543523 [Nemania sp. FL0916]
MPTFFENLWPNKESGQKRPANPEGRGAKRKAKRDPYEAIEDDDDSDIIPAQKTPTSQRTARSRPSTTTPSSSTNPRVSLSGKRPRGRPSLKSQQGDASGATTASRIPAEALPAHADAQDIARTQPDSSLVAPEAPMGSLALLDNNSAADASAPPLPNPRPELEPDDEAPPQRRKGNRRARQAETVSAQQAQDEAPAVLAPAPAPAPAAVNQEMDTREEREIAQLLEHRMSHNQDGAVELLVLWANEGREDATWEAEEEIQKGAEEILYDYWRAQGGRANALFHRPKPQVPEIYHVFKVLRHERRNRGGFQFEVQWVGHPATRGETTMEAETKLKNIAPGLLDEYWESVGGRASHLAQRGRAKKTRTE